MTPPHIPVYNGHYRGQHGRGLGNVLVSGLRNLAIPFLRSAARKLIPLGAEISSNLIHKGASALAGNLGLTNKPVRKRRAVPHKGRVKKSKSVAPKKSSRKDALS